VYDRTDKNITLSDFIARTRAISPFAEPDGEYNATQLFH
jgi:hypothetical protein